MDPIYVTGHRNPDTDSIVAAMAYAALRNALGDREYQAARLGHISDETQRVLHRFGFEPPVHIKSMHTQIRDLEYEVPPVLSSAVTLSRAWEVFRQNSQLPGVPLAKEDGTLYGLLRPTDIAEYDMETIDRPRLERVPVFNLLSALEGKLLNEAEDSADLIDGQVIIALPQSREGLLFSDTDSVVICGNQPELIRRALELNVNCLILCQTELSEELRALKTSTCIISTPFDAYRTVRLIYHSTPVGRICRRENIVTFHLDDFVDDVRETVLKERAACYPILDGDEKIVGLLYQNHLLRPRRKRVVLVDHNEKAQSVPGLEEAEILEIIDHHRLADIETRGPISVRNEPVGSTNTIIASMFQERGLMPSEKMAGLIAAAIVSDTVMFKSPTCTEKDRRMAARMARIGKVSLEELGRVIFSGSAGEEHSLEDLLFSDFKEFHIAGHFFGVGQVTCMDSPRLLARKGEFLELMEKTAREKGYGMMLLMLTDVLLEGTQLIYLGDDDTMRHAFNTDVRDNEVFLPKVMSRKKQIIPMLTALWG
ncbi:MAG: putative manganese-dependent inorganic diphosphatase [Faecousia sp.]